MHHCISILIIAEHADAFNTGRKVLTADFTAVHPRAIIKDSFLVHPGPCLCFQPPVFRRHLISGLHEKLKTAPSGAPTKERNTMRVLFIGNSHTYFNDMPALFARFCRASGTETEVTMLSHSGKPLEWHRSEYFEERFNLLHGGYDFCVIQQQAHPFPEPKQSGETIGYLTGLCAAAHTLPVLYMTWAEKACPENQKLMTETYRQIAADTGARLAPVGEAWERVRSRHPEIELYWRDGMHASAYGSYLAAAVLFAAVTGKSPRNLPDTAIDFSLESGLDLNNPAVLENPDQVFVSPRPDWCAAIREAAAACMEDEG